MLKPIHKQSIRYPTKSALNRGKHFPLNSYLGLENLAFSNAIVIKRDN